MTRPDPHSGLPGDAELPHWQQALTARLNNHVAARPQWLRQDQDTQMMPTRFSCTAYLPMKALVDAAAASRGIGRSSYVRRALAAMVAHDLGMDFADVAKHLPYPCPPGRGPSKKVALEGAMPDDGQGYGPWQITEVVGE